MLKWPVINGFRGGETFRREKKIATENIKSDIGDCFLYMNDDPKHIHTNTYMKSGNLMTNLYYAIPTSGTNFLDNLHQSLFKLSTELNASVRLSIMYNRYCRGIKDDSVSIDYTRLVLLNFFEFKDFDKYAKDYDLKYGTLIIEIE